METKKHNSRRQELEDQKAAKKQTLVDDDSGNAAAGAVVTIAVAMLVLFILWRVVNAEAAATSVQCSVDYADDPVGETKCKKNNENLLTIGGIVVLLALLGAGGLYKFRSRRRA